MNFNVMRRFDVFLFPWDNSTVNEYYYGANDKLTPADVNESTWLMMFLWSM
jgi:hypothetical protein